MGQSRQNSWPILLWSTDVIIIINPQEFLIQVINVEHLFIDTMHAHHIRCSSLQEQWDLAFVWGWIYGASVLGTRLKAILGHFNFIVTLSYDIS